MSSSAGGEVNKLIGECENAQVRAVIDSLSAKLLFREGWTVRL